MEESNGITSTTGMSWFVVVAGAEVVTGVGRVVDVVDGMVVDGMVVEKSVVVMGDDVLRVHQRSVSADVDDDRDLTVGSASSAS